MHPDRATLADAELLFEGVLIAPAVARVKQLDTDGHTVPVVILELESPRGMHMPLRVEQAFPVGRMDQAEAAARRYRKGLHVTVQASAMSVRFACVATHIHTHKDNENTTEPTT